MLYFGPRFFLPTLHKSVKYPKAPARNASRNVHDITLEACKGGNSGAHQSPTITANLAGLPNYQFFPALAQSLADHDLAFQRGIFRHIKTAKRQHSLPHAQVYAAPEQYARLLDKLEAAGLLHWTETSQEAQEYSRLAKDIEMTLFTVSKSPSRTRVISWPRVQNDSMPQPPYTSLPNPTMFEAVRMAGESPAAFFLDISNMFHNITLPLWMSRLLPMKPIPFSALSAETQLRIACRTSLPSNTHRLMLRPTQATMPMGFKWAVYIAHTFVSSCFDQSFQLLKASRRAIPAMTLTKLRAEDAPFLVKASAPLLLHFIDDAVIVAAGWSPELIRTWHRLSRKILQLNSLPVSEAKSSPCAHIVRGSVTFIGCRWHLPQGLILPSPGKLEKATTQAKSLLETLCSSQKAWERVTGRLVWFAMLNRPLLSCTASIFNRTGDTKLHPMQHHQSARKRELRTLTALLPFARVELKLPLHHIIIAFDASTIAGAVTYAEVEPAVAEQIWAAAQSARFNTHRPSRFQLEEVRDIVTTCSWKKAFIHHWRAPEHINCLEACTAVMAVEWLARSRISNTGVILLTDSLVTLGAFQKGRSSQPALLARCRPLAALALAHNFRLTFAYVRSNLNPADKYTRIPTGIQ